MAKKLLVLSIVATVIGLAFVTNLINVQNTVALYVALPLGAVFLGLFLMFRSFEKEMALYDKEQQGHPAYKAAKKDRECECAGVAHGKTSAAR
jgi:hypothetical protein